MNDIQISENKEELTLTTIDIADMMEMPHWQILRKLDGTKKIKGIIQILGDNKIVVTDYFIPSTYLSEQNKEMPCYKVTRMGCEFLANKYRICTTYAQSKRHITPVMDIHRNTLLICLILIETSTIRRQDTSITYLLKNKR